MPRRKVRKILDATAMQEKLMAAVEYQVKEDVKRSPPEKPAAPPGGVTASWLRWSLTLGGVAVVLAVAGGFWFHRRRKRGSVIR